MMQEQGVTVEVFEWERKLGGYAPSHLLPTDPKPYTDLLVRLFFFLLLPLLSSSSSSSSSPLLLLFSSSPLFFRAEPQSRARASLSPTAQCG
jgi:hypothetical protein